MARRYLIDDGDPPLDALEVIRRNATPLHLGSGPGDPLTARRIANWAIALAAAVPVLWLVALTVPRSAEPAPAPPVAAPTTDLVVLAFGILPLILLPFGFALGLASMLMTPRRARGWIALVLPVAIVAGAIGLIISSDDFGR
jgi:hypothetical protein